MYLLLKVDDNQFEIDMLLTLVVVVDNNYDDDDMNNELNHLFQ
jgi:hypothetical protein